MAKKKAMQTYSLSRVSVRLQYVAIMRFVALRKGQVPIQCMHIGSKKTITEDPKDTPIYLKKNSLAWIDSRYKSPLFTARRILNSTSESEPQTPSAFEFPLNDPFLTWLYDLYDCSTPDLRLMPNLLTEWTTDKNFGPKSPVLGE